MSQPGNYASLLERAIKGIAWSAISSWGSQLTQFVTMIVLARLLSPTDFGLISLANIFIHFVQALIGSGFSDAIVQRDDLETEHLDTAFWINLGIGLTLTSIGVLSAGLVASFFRQPLLVPIVSWLSLNVLINSIASVHEAILRRKLKFKQLAIRRLIGLVIGAIVGITLALNGFGVWSLVCQTLVGNTVDVILLLNLSQWSPRFHLSLKHFQDLFSFGINVVGNGILTFVSNRSDDLIIGYFLGAEVLGYYAVAYKLLVVMSQLFGQTVQKVVLPTFSRLQGDPEQLKRSFYSGSQLLNLIAFPAFLGMAVLAPELVSTIFGEQWAFSGQVMQVLAFVGVIDSAAYFSGAIFMAKGRPDWLFKLLLFHTVIMTSAFLIAVPYGLIMIALARVVATLILFTLGLWLLCKLVQLDLLTYFKHLSTPLIASLLMACAILIAKSLVENFIGLKIGENLLLGGYIFLGGITYGLAILLIEPRIIKKMYDLGKLALPGHKA
ncbi:MAG: MOP flippase family protein [Elainella sp. Prado103]|jgi:PST family polysaccharide transporter|nr:MOP flippase family protein [Elainella sp. Prado103]